MTNDVINMLILRIIVTDTTIKYYIKHSKNYLKLTFNVQDANLALEMIKLIKTFEKSSFSNFFLLFWSNQGNCCQNTRTQRQT